MLVKAALPDHIPNGQHTYRVVVPQTEQKVYVMVDLRGSMRVEHPNKQKTFRFVGKDDICRCWSEAVQHGVDLYWLAPPPRIRAVRVNAAAPDVRDVESNQEVAAVPNRFVPRPDGLPPPPGFYRVHPGDSSSSSSEVLDSDDGEDSSSSGYHFPPGFFEAEEMKEASEEEEEPEEEEHLEEERRPSTTWNKRFRKE